jgi:uncharacterized protein (TIGR02118 family)
MKMIKLSILMVRRSDLTYDRFIHYWREVHAPLFAAQSESKRYVRRYIQDHRTRDTLPGTTASNFDGIAEIWFDDISGAKAFFESDGYQKNVILTKKHSWIASAASCCTPTNSMSWAEGPDLFLFICNVLSCERILR